MGFWLIFLFFINNGIIHLYLDYQGQARLLFCALVSG